MRSFAWVTIVNAGIDHRSFRHNLDTMAMFHHYNPKCVGNQLSAQVACGVSENQQGDRGAYSSSG